MYVYEVQTIKAYIDIKKNIIWGAEPTSQKPMNTYCHPGYDGCTVTVQEKFITCLTRVCTHECHEFLYDH